MEYFFKVMVGGELGLNAWFGGLKEHRAPVLRMVLLLLVVLVAFTALAVQMDEDSSDDDGLQGFASWQALTIALPFLAFSLSIALTSSFKGKTQAAEYLQGHIGEKRFADDLAGLSVCARVESLVTVLLERRHFLIPAAVHGISRDSRPLLLNVPAPLPEGKILMSGGTSQ